uniref:C2H2-type domain-containing protein n=1 Tax=Acanthochromis polyacanthus TaxID=80966 RepID=A0A3Q1F389_9TELE
LGPGAIVVKIVSESDSNDASTAAEFENSIQPESNISDKCYPPSKLERHRRTHSKTPKVPHQCSYCMKTFSKLNKLVRHKRMHTGEKPFTCSVCGKGFSESGHCKAHEKTHEEQPEKPHCCADCGMCFFKASELRRHFRSHTGEKPFRCTLCEKSTSKNCQKTFF